MTMQQQHEDASKEFLAIPWTAAYLKRPNVRLYVPGSRYKKSTNEDALFGYTLNSAKTIGSCITVYEQPLADAKQISEIHTLMSIGSGMDGWPRILHGGIVATVIDEAMGTLLSTQAYLHRTKAISGDESAKGDGSFTATLNIAYKSPVRTPNPLVITTRYIKREGRKDWIFAEIRQFDDAAGKEVVCATGEALFIAKKAKL